MRTVVWVSGFLSVLLCAGAAFGACGGGFFGKALCEAGAITEKQADTLDRLNGSVGMTLDKMSQEVGSVLDPVVPLLPVRSYITTVDIPPVGFGAYGIVSFQAKATDANAAKLKMVCNSFVATFPKNSQVPPDVPLSDRMITLWPIFHTDDPAAEKDDCDFVINDYDLAAAGLAMKDAKLQGGEFDGEGPYLIGWSPSSSRGQKDKLVLVVDLSAANDQTSVDRLFLFWKQKVVDNPEAWRGGFSLERLRVAIKDFADKYGQDMLDAIKLVSAK